MSDPFMDVDQSSDVPINVPYIDFTMKLSSPVRMVATDHAGFQRSGWKSLIERQSRVLV